MNLIPELEKLGLGSKESKVLLAALELGSAPLSVIARRAGVKRPTAHYVIPSLLARGLLAKVPKKKRIVYAAVPPEKLMHTLSEQRQTLTTILPMLEGLFRSKPTHPIVRFYEGKEGLATLYQEFFSTHKTLYSVISPEFSVFPENEVANFFQLLRDSGGRIMELVHRLPGPSDERYLTAAWRRGVSQAKSLPEDMYFTLDIFATDEKVAFFSMHTLVAVVIDDPEIARSQKSLIQFVWRNVKKGIIVKMGG